MARGLNKQEVISLAKEFKYLNDFRKSNKSAYHNALRNKFVDELGLEKVGDKMNRCIYVYLFEDKSFYVGLTFNINARHKDHLLCKRSPIYKKVEKGIAYDHTQLTDYISANLAQREEQYYIDLFESKGYDKLNSQNAGNLGGRKKKLITKQQVLDTAKKCKSAGDMGKRFYFEYSQAKKFKYTK